MTEIDSYSIEEVARRLSISQRQVHRLIARQELPSVLVGRRRLVRREALLDWLDRLPSQTAA